MAVRKGFLIPLFSLASFGAVACHDEAGETPSPPPAPSPFPEPGGPSGQVTRSLESHGMKGAFVASHNGINRGEGAVTTTSTLSWNVSEARSCSLDGVDVPVQGQKSVSPETDTNYRLLCKSDEGELESTIAIAVARIDSFASQNPAVFDWEENALSWESHHTASCSPEGGGFFAYTGTTVKHKGPGSFRLSCTGFNGERLRKSLEVTRKSDAPIVSFSLDKQGFNLENPDEEKALEVRASWDVKNVQQCHISAETGIDVPAIDVVKEPKGSIAFKIKSHRFGRKVASSKVELACSQAPYGRQTEATQTVRFAWLERATLREERAYRWGERAQVNIVGENLSECGISVPDAAGNTLNPITTLDFDDSGWANRASFLVERGGKHLLSCKGFDGHVFLRELDVALDGAFSRAWFSTLRLAPDASGVSRKGLTFEAGYRDSAVVEWKAEGASECRWDARSEAGKRLIKDLMESAPTEGKFTVRSGEGALVESETFTLTCKDARGVEASAPFPVEVSPIELVSESVYLNDDEPASVFIRAPHAPAPCRVFVENGDAGSASERSVTLSAAESAKTVRALCPGFEGGRNVEKSIELWKISSLSSVCANRADVVSGNVTIRDEHAYDLFRFCKSFSGIVTVAPRESGERLLGAWARDLRFEAEHAKGIRVLGTRDVHSIAFPSLKSADEVHLSLNSSLAAASFPDVLGYSDLEVSDNPLLASLAVPREEKGGSVALKVKRNPRLASLEVSHLELASSFEIDGNGVVELDAPALKGVSSLLSVSSSPALRSVRFPALETAYRVFLRDIPVKNLDLSSVRKMEDLIMVRLPLEKLDISKTVGLESLELSESGAEAGELSIAWPACAGSQMGSFTFEGNRESLRELAVPLCRRGTWSYVGRISVRENQGLQRLMLHAPDTAGTVSASGLAIESNPRLEETRLVRVHLADLGRTLENPFDECGSKELLFRNNGTAQGAATLAFEEYEEGSFCIEKNPTLRSVSFTTWAGTRRPFVESGRIRANRSLASLTGVELLGDEGHRESLLAIHDNGSFRLTREEQERLLKLPFTNVILDPQ